MVVVTGSYIKGSPVDGASPVEIISRDTIDALSASTVADITANLAINNGSENQVDSFTVGGGQGSSNVNLRGLGSSRTLVLVNGRRLAPGGAEGAPYAPNVGLIPAGLVSQYEVLTDGASSVYGSDATGRVANIIMKKDYEMT